MDHLGQENYKPSPVLEKALDVLFLLHADHELNASCTTVLQTGSSLVDPYSAVASVVLCHILAVVCGWADVRLLLRETGLDAPRYSKCLVRCCEKPS